jgi:hypothetical protein
MVSHRLSWLLSWSTYPCTIARHFSEPTMLA